MKPLVLVANGHNMGARPGTLFLLLALVPFTNGCVYLMFKSVQQHRAVAAMHGKPYSYRLKEPTQFLAADFAVATARETLRREGFDTNVWTVVPSAHRDRATNQVRSTVFFQHGGVRRQFDVRLNGDKVICQSLFTGQRRKRPKTPEHYPKPPRTGKG